MKRANLALVGKTQAAVVTVAARPAGKDKFGNIILDQKAIDRLPEGYVATYSNQRLVQVVGIEGSEGRPRSLWERLRDWHERARDKRTQERQIDKQRRF